MSDTRIDVRLDAEWRDAVLDATAAYAEMPAAAVIVAQAGRERASRTAVIAELEEIRIAAAELQASLDAARARQLATRRWNVRDVVAHLASWAWQTRMETERLVTRQPFDEIIPFGVDGPHAWNQRAVDERRDRSLPELFVEIDAEHERIAELVAAMSDDEFRRVADLPRTLGVPPAPWSMTIGAMILMSCWHARLHLKRIDQLLGRP